MLDGIMSNNEACFSLVYEKFRTKHFFKKKINIEHFSYSFQRSNDLTGNSCCTKEENRK